MGRLVQLALLALLALTACTISDPDPTPVPPTLTRAIPPTPTVDALLQPTRPVRSNFELYSSEPGRFTIQHPKDWSVSEQEGLVEIAAPDRAALVRVLFEPVDPSLSNEDLSYRAVDRLRARYGERFVEHDRRLQNDQSISVDFTLEEEPQLLGKLFVESRESVFYQLMLLVEADQLDRYETDINFIISSYALPGTSNQSTGRDPQSRVRRFFYELAEAFSDPMIDNADVQDLRARRIVSYFPPDLRPEAEQEFKLVLSELGSTLATYRDPDLDISMRATVSDLSTSLVSESANSAEVDVEQGSMTITFTGADVDLLPLPADKRTSVRPLSSFLGNQQRVRLVMVGGVWYLDRA